MEHIVQFAVGIDDQRIVNVIEESAARDITKNLQQMVMNKIFQSSYYKSDARNNDPLSDFSKRLIDEFLERHKDVILEKTSVYLADKLARTKAAKEIIAKTRMDGE